MGNFLAAPIRGPSFVGPRRSIAAAVMLGLVVLPVRGVWAATPTDEIRGFLDRASNIVENVELAPMERLGAVRAMLADAFDVRSAAELALGPYWHSRTLAERREFVPLFADLLERSYLSQIKSRLKPEGRAKIAYLAESADGDRATVRTILRREGREDVPFDYQMIRRGKGWAVRDVVIEGVSLVGNYRAQFVKTIQDSSYRELILRMKAKDQKAKA